MAGSALQAYDSQVKFRHLAVMALASWGAVIATAATDQLTASAKECTAGSIHGEAPAKIEQACNQSIGSGAFAGSELAMLYLGRANLHDFVGDKALALSDYDKALELAPAAKGIHYNRGVFFTEQGDLNAAREDYDAELKLDSRSVPALYNRARILAAQNHLDEAAADYSAAIAVGTHEPRLYADRGGVYLRQNRLNDAVADETEAIRLKPELAIAYFTRSTAYAELGDPQQAQQDAETAIRLDPTLARRIRINQNAPPP